MQLTELSSERLERIVSGASSVSSRNSSSSYRVKRDFPDEDEEDNNNNNNESKDPFGTKEESTGFLKTPESELGGDSPTVVVTRDDIREVEKVEKDIQGWVNDRRGSLRPPPVVADSFGETWKEKTQRILGENKTDSELVSLIAKSFDDLRQEVFTMQLIDEMKKIWSRAHVPVFVRSYTILSTCSRVIAQRKSLKSTYENLNSRSNTGTSSSTGLIETITNATSLDSLKKREGYVSLRKHFVDNYGPLSSPRFAAAQLNFLQSLAGYSILSYLIGFKDRHNGNLLIDNQGHILHIDFGFILGIAPGGKFSIETAPFKLTQEYVVDVSSYRRRHTHTHTHTYLQVCRRTGRCGFTDVGTVRG